MHQDPEHEEYDDDEYKYYPQNDQDNQSIPFSFDWNAWELWLSDVIKEIVADENNDSVSWTFTFPDYSASKQTKTNNSLDDQEASKKFLYLGQNLFDEGMWKYKYFIKNYINIEYQQHLISHAKYVLSQPLYYRSLYEIMN